ncbi:hypothetical protein WUBG_05779 [Wuchereria bancrofti]|uniref:Uncharacterized protein n=1 Tax=Wuchereria bancrofti TaxID=6293 RepID=J9EM86_WUCBA|nr:hypothetical protein WUBG_05779 [Wuchereria bancrofti]
MQASRSDSGSVIALPTLYLLSWVGCEDVQGQLPPPLSPCSPSVLLFQIYATIIVAHSNLISNFKNAASMSEAIMGISKLPVNYGTTTKDSGISSDNETEEA